MTDTIVEFINTAGKTFAELQAGITIAANGANEQAVIKDLIVKNQRQRALSLRVGANEIAAIQGSVRLSGSELLAANTQLTLRTTEQLVANSLNVLVGGVTRTDFPSVFNNSSPPPSVEGVNTVTSVPSFTNTPSFACIAATGDFYYFAQGMATLYRRAGGPTGAETAYPAFATGVCYDGERYIYGITSNAVKTLDTQTGTIVDTKTLSGYNPQAMQNTCNHCCAIDGWVFYRPGPTSANVLVNAATGVTYHFGADDAGEFYSLFNGVGKDSEGNYIFVQTCQKANQELKWWSPGKTFGVAPKVQFSGNIAKGFYSRNGQANYIHRIAGADNIIAFAGHQRIEILDLTTFTIKSSLIGNSVGNGGDVYYLSRDNARAATDFGTIDVRATGVKVTA